MMTGGTTVGEVPGVAGMTTGTAGGIAALETGVAGKLCICFIKSLVAAYELSLEICICRCL